MQHGHVVLGSQPADRVEDRDERRPVRRIVGGRRRGRKQPGIIDQDAIIDVSRIQRTDLVEHGTFVVLAGRYAPTPMSVQPVKRGNRLRGQRPQDPPRIAMNRAHVVKVGEAIGRAPVKIGRRLNRDHRREGLRQRARSLSKKGSCLDRALEVEEISQVGREARRKSLHLHALCRERSSHVRPLIFRQDPAR